jgi:hypothetical protein
MKNASGAKIAAKMQNMMPEQAFDVCSSGISASDLFLFLC